MIDATVAPLLAVVAVLVAVAAVVAALVTARATRRAAERATAEAARTQAETLRWTSEQLTRAVDRFHSQLGEFGRRLGEGQAETGAAVQRSLAEQVRALSDSVNRQLAASQKTLTDGFTGATETFGRLQSRLGQVSEMASRMEQLAGNVRELGDILRVPKLRGLLGEQALEAMLRQVLPKRFWDVQHRFSDGRIVDAVVRLGEALVPVDAKFPLEAYRRLATAGDDDARRAARRDFTRAVKVRVDEIAERYIRPGEGTVGFALMYVPAEGVYAEIVAATEEPTDELLEYALGRRVLPVSPATLFAYLSVVASGLHGFEVEARAREIIRALAATDHELGRLRDEVEILGKHLHNASIRFGEVEKRLDTVEARLHDASRVSEPPADGGEPDRRGHG